MYPGIGKKKKKKTLGVFFLMSVDVIYQTTLIKIFVQWGKISENS